MGAAEVRAARSAVQQPGLHETSDARFANDCRRRVERARCFARERIVDYLRCAGTPVCEQQHRGRVGFLFFGESWRVAFFKRTKWSGFRRAGRERCRQNAESNRWRIHTRSCHASHDARRESSTSGTQCDSPTGNAVFGRRARRLQWFQRRLPQFGGLFRIERKQLGKILVWLQFWLVLALIRRPAALSDSDETSKTAPESGAVHSLVPQIGFDTTVTKKSCRRSRRQHRDPRRHPPTWRISPTPSFSAQAHSEL